MGELDLKALRAKLNQLKGQANRSNSIWKPTKGESIVRIVPSVNNKHNPFVELYFHYLGQKTYLSPLSYGNPDPIAEFADKLFASKEEESRTLAKELRAKLRTYVPVIVRGEEKEGVRFWSFGKTVYEKLLAIINDPDYGDITDPMTGRDMVVAFTPQKESDTNFAKTDVRMKPNTSPLAQDPTMVKKFLTEQPNLRELYQEPTYDELKGILEAYIAPESATQQLKRPAMAEEQYPKDWNEPTKAAAPATPPPATAPDKGSSAPSKKSAAELDAEFDQIFG